eukprot:CAMPEP_0172530962 /NCGR_PEP_ID=MMETSP1067-20121228/4546_1 /TAXON_ID=265564 ORGANISM="Thalassiosira punctigera, Strain Tpunct2005C2" /NCGR_SAMPLE_ID=MMETSP1067 /ASSEMBLY_ACC=CAM_ASM_000444 /LENGTH=203 /DNA_ID=CAMNT_0013315277 /DNA_START=33 /DNA_END=644 /DNA_ORIENTATION=+
MIALLPIAQCAATGHTRRLIALLSAACFLTAVGVAATDKSGTKYLEKKSTEAGVVTLPSGLLYKVLRKGRGAFHPRVDSPCSCHYAGTLVDGTEFDSSYSRGEPSTFAPNDVIKGWTEAMQMMVEGDKWELYIPSDLAYGKRGRLPTIPGNAALVFTLELIEIQGRKSRANDANVPLSSIASAFSILFILWIFFRQRGTRAMR